MSCAAPERELVPFLAAGTLAGEERAVAAAHAAACAACGAELRASRELVDALGTLHLTSDEIVHAAWGGGAAPHLDDCPRCRSEVDMLRQVNAELSTGPPRQTVSRAGAFLAWAAVVMLAVPAVLYFKNAAGPTAAPVTRGGGGAAPGMAVTAAIALSSAAPATLPRRAVLLEVPVLETAAGERVELRLLDPGGRTRLHEPDLPVQQGRGRLALDAAAIDPGTWRLELRRIGADEATRSAVSYVLTVPAP
jgi:hypothetical protein